MEDKLKIWKQVEQPPAGALKPITGGRLKGKTDINPQWRLGIMTEVFGPCGQGWWFTVDKQWLEPGADGEVAAFVNITLYTDDCDKGVPGNGGAMFVANERGGSHTSDEAYKMATTDALSVAMKCLGVAAVIYQGGDATKYSQPEAEKDEGYELLKAEAAFDTAWARVLDAIGEDDADNAKALRRKFFKTTTEKSSAFKVMSDSTAGMTAKEVKLITAMLTKGHAKVEGLCLGKWRVELGLPSLEVETCTICNAVLTEAEKASCVIAKLPGYWCGEHVTEGIKKAQEAKDEA